MCGRTLVSVGVSVRTDSGARLEGPNISAPFVVRVGVTPYVVTTTGQPYGVTDVIMLTGLCCITSAQFGRHLLSSRLAR